MPSIYDRRHRDACHARKRLPTQRPIQLDWFCLVGPALLINYFGQGALLLSNPEAAHNPFYRLAPAWGHFPLLVLATLAAVIASQAIISGAFSLTRQAVQLGYLPRVDIIHTSATEIGQIYIPGVNWALMAATIAVVVGFRSSSNVAAAYGVALTTTMLITTLLAFVVAHRIWGWSIWLAGLVTALFLVADLAFFGDTMVKVLAGGWLPLAVAAAVLALMTTWQLGRSLLGAKIAQRLVPVEAILGDIERQTLPRARGTAVYLTGDPEGTPISGVRAEDRGHGGGLLPSKPRNGRWSLMARAGGPAGLGSGCSAGAPSVGLADARAGAVVAQTARDQRQVVQALGDVRRSRRTETIAVVALGRDHGRIEISPS